MIRIKICGNTSVVDALDAARAGAHAIGLILYEHSPRCIDPEEAARICAAMPPFVTTVGVFVNESIDTIRILQREIGFDLVQLHGDEPPEMVEEFGPRTIKALRLHHEDDLAKLDAYASAGALLLDTPKEGVYGGSGEVGDWHLAKLAVDRLLEKGQPIILAGGLNPENVATAIRRVTPFGVDVASGVEAQPGAKDRTAMRRFVVEAAAAGIGLR
ncbi:MAG: phosphoribosylanthranilate isomerase [Chrysiogenetes bacterium]|nr:phosphoribosylanthranilate isomerase [Chrysiogenetes bacterium]